MAYKKELLKIAAFESLLHKRALAHGTDWKRERRGEEGRQREREHANIQLQFKGGRFLSQREQRAYCYRKVINGTPNQTQQRRRRFGGNNALREKESQIVDREQNVRRLSQQQVYVSEVSSPRLRTTLNAGISGSYNVGMVAIYTLGAFFHWKALAAVSAAFPLVGMVCMLFVPETPAWYVTKGNNDDPRRAFLFGGWEWDHQPFPLSVLLQLT